MNDTNQISILLEIAPGKPTKLEAVGTLGLIHEKIAAVLGIQLWAKTTDRRIKENKPGLQVDAVMKDYSVFANEALAIFGLEMAMTPIRQLLSKGDHAAKESLVRVCQKHFDHRIQIKCSKKGEATLVQIDVEADEVTGTNAHELIAQSEKIITEWVEISKGKHTATKVALPEGVYSSETRVEKKEEKKSPDTEDLSAADALIRTATKDLDI